MGPLLHASKLWVGGGGGGGWVAYRILVSAPVPFWVYWGWNWVGLGWDWVWGDWGHKGWGLGLDNKWKLASRLSLKPYILSVPLSVRNVVDQVLSKTLRDMSLCDSDWSSW